MSRTLTNIQQALKLSHEGSILLDQAARVLANGPADYYFRKIEEYVNALFDRFAPFQVGDRIRLKAAPDTSGSWSACTHFMVPGAVGTVQGMDYCNGAFVADVVFTDESWIDDKGAVQPAVQKHYYRLHERLLEKIVDTVLEA